jgi:ribonuclease HII
MSNINNEMSKLNNQKPNTSAPPSPKKSPRENPRTVALFRFDQQYFERSEPFAGIDEAGRGPLAGAVVAGCVVMPAHPMIDGIDDSKRLSEKKREALYQKIIETAVFCGTGFASVSEIERENIVGATKLAMLRAAQNAPCRLFLVDGLSLALPGETVPIIKGDALSYSIAAASIIAKVARDRLMRELDEKYPQYGFAKHKGYGTKAHIEAIRTFGPCAEHRSLFVRKFVY